MKRVQQRKKRNEGDSVRKTRDKTDYGCITGLLASHILGQGPEPAEMVL